MYKKRIVILSLIFFCSSVYSNQTGLKFIDSIDDSMVEIRSTKVNDLSAAKKDIKQRIHLLMRQFEALEDPYSGKVLLPEKCRKENLPKIHSKEDEKSITKVVGIYSSTNKIIGDCSQPKKLMKTQYLLLYCKNTQKLHYIKYFYDDSKHWTKKAIVSCL